MSRPSNDGQRCKNDIEIDCSGVQINSINNSKHQKTPPDPLTIAEMERILSDMIERFHLQVAHYFTFAFLTGMRSEEIIALRWDDIDWNNRTIRVARAKTFKGRFKDLKTSEVRDVDLVDRAVNALQAQKRFTYMKAAEIFENPVTGRPWHDERSQRDHYWKPSLKKLGIRA
ncbi:tyrosine-type recombinase/integrase [Collimonas pratensis]|uniref:tyrosine-type recombinase/integrase n=1 Tax=Collimonas pratensis TaxID=279113 RepID=UPI00143CDFA0|nr:tyrosine-type recombinase/integrase [Collimonas pratensis]